MFLPNVCLRITEEQVSQTQTRLTAEDLLRLPTGNGKRYELLDGELIEMAAAGYRHGKDALRIGAIIRNFVVSHHLGDVVAAETGFTLRRNPDHVRAPDVAFIAAGRLPPGPDPVGFAEIAPDFVVEVVSPGDTATEIQERIDDWLRAGVKVVWAAYSVLKAVVVWRGVGNAERRAGDEEIDAEPAIPGFRCKVSDLFED